MEHALDAFAVGGHVAVAGAQEQVVGGFLNLDEVRHFEDFADSAVVLPQTLLTKEGLSHMR